jgi:hypothetical protein
MQEHYRLVDGVSELEGNLIFGNATWKVIKDAFKHARCISVATYYTEVKFTSLLHASVEVIYFLHWHAHVILLFILVLKQQMKPTEVDLIYLTKEQHLQGGVDLLVKDQEARD